MSRKIFSNINFLDKEEPFGIIRYNEPSKSFANEHVHEHAHEFIEICYVFSGSGYHVFNNRKYDVCKGDLFIINFDMEHAFYSENTENKLITYNVMFKPDYLDKSLINLHDFDSISYSHLFKKYWPHLAGNYDLRLDANEQVHFDDLVDKMYQEYIARKSGYLTIIRGYLIVYLSRIARLFASNSGTETTKDYGDYIKDKIINQIIDELKINFNKKLNLQEIAKKALFSKSYICNLFKQSTGMTLSEYINNIRIDEACTMIKSENRSFYEIAELVGFSDYRIFYGNFKKIVGVSPSVYRKK